MFARRTEISSHSHQVIRLLSEVCDTILYPWGPQYHDDEYREYLHGLESRLMKPIAVSGLDIGPAPRNIIKEISPALELFRLAALAYLERASKNFSGQSAKLNAYTEETFEILTKLDLCPYPFPLFIFGCDANTDARRMAIPDLISKTERHLYVRNLDEVSKLIQPMWVQEDLEPDGEVGFIRKLNLAMSMSNVVPGFV